MTRYFQRPLVVLILAIGLLASCTNDKRQLPDVSAIEAPLLIDRFDQDFFEMDTVDFKQSLISLSEKYPVFADLFSARILEAGEIGKLNDEQIDYLRGYSCSPVYRAVYDTTQMLYANMNDFQGELQQAMRYYRYYFPNELAPERVVMFSSAFNYSAIIFGENELGVSLDMFLGPGFDYQQYGPGATIFSDYLVRTYNKDHMIASLLRVLIDDLFGNAKGSRLLDEMVHRGKKLYVLDQLLPLAADTVKFRVTGEQWEWLEENERNLWTHFLTEDLLYNSRYQDIRKLIEQSPSGAPALPEESPGETANYVGYHIIKQFFERNPELPLSELLVYQDAQEILEMSKYKPPRQ